MALSKEIHLSFFFLLVLANFSHAGKIEHVVSLMLENRAFDHMLGYLKAQRPEVDGLTGNEWNPRDPADSNSERIYVSNKAGYRIVSPSHSIPSSFEQAYGVINGSFQAYPNAPMNGFVANFAKVSKSNSASIMESFDLKKIPVLTTLANEYALFDRWYASLPGPTVTNRFFFHAADYENPGDSINAGVNLKTIFDSLTENNLTWKAYYPEWTSLAWFTSFRKPENVANLRLYHEFAKDAAAGKLPNYTFIEPRYFTLSHAAQAQDQHPANSVYFGELLIKEVYEILRACPLWEKTALLITYDEHGGFYDHSPLVITGVPNPKNFSDKVLSYFSYEALGMRVPTIVVSPWVQKGRLVHDPANGPFPTSKFDHTSLAATLKRMWGMENYLTSRDEWAGSFEFLFDELDEPRTDTPKQLKGPPCDTATRVLAQDSLSDLHKEWIDYAHNLAQHPHSPAKENLTTNAEGGEFVALKMMEWKAAIRKDANQTCFALGNEYNVCLQSSLYDTSQCELQNQALNECWCHHFGEDGANPCYDQCVTYRNCIGGQSIHLKEICIKSFEAYKTCLLAPVQYAFGGYTPDPCDQEILQWRVFLILLLAVFLLAGIIGVSAGVKKFLGKRRNAYALLVSAEGDLEQESELDEINN